MATLNGNHVNFQGLTLAQIGEKLLDSSPSKDGRGIVLDLTLSEEDTFVEIGGFTVGRTIVTLIADLIEKRTGKKPQNLAYIYHNQSFTT